MKKIRAFLLLIIVAAAAFTPCCTEEACPDEITATSKPDHSKADDGGCSPFFACTGCPGFTLMDKPITVPIPAEYQPEFFETAFDFIPAAFTTAPWQPPRTI